MRFIKVSLLALLLAGPAPASAGTQAVDLTRRPVRSLRSHDFDVQHYRIRLAIDDERRTVDGETTVTLRPLKDDFRTCVLDAETFTVSAVRDASGSNLEFRQTPTSLRIELARPYRHDETVVVTVSYRLVNPKVDAKAYGMEPSYRLGLDFKEPGPRNPAMVSTLSFPQGARHWFPSYDDPDDKATSDIIVTVRRDHSVVSNGRLVGVTADEQAGTRTFHWAQEQPHSTYLFMLAAGPYVVVRDTLGTLPIAYWVYPQDEPHARRTFGRTPDVIRFFNERFGYPYPWAKYDQVIIPGIGGGAESTTATVIGESAIVPDDRAMQDFPSDWLVAHEAAHHWWGDLVTMRTWSETWINEGFATFSEHVYTCHARGPDECALDLRQKQDSYFAEARTRYARPIVFERYEYPNENFDRHTYQKGAVVLDMLRFVLGEEPFWRAVSRFLHAHAFGSADTNDLVVAIHEATGQNLDWFFEQWVRKPGHPVLVVTQSWDEAARRLSLRVRQTQDTSKGIPIFRMPVDVEIVTSRGATRHRIQLESADQSFSLEAVEKPLLVRFDKGNHLLDELTFAKDTTELLYQLGHDDVSGRVWAASELGGRLAESGVREALHAATGDRSWAVRERALTVLAASDRSFGVDQLRALATDPSSRVRVAALKALGARRDATLLPFYRERFERDDSYLAQAEALRSIGMAGDRASLPLLEQAAATPSPRNVIRLAAEWAREEIGRAR
ncbi:aminopeptidase [Luteitalea sp. TBR-22]|uniref:M1 family aminopeptidase n=1 Tax=Luteitalea sp. TBR-22 TaxID=2802971 RepID=UPI001AF88BE8|nr:M1 family aminopeptidase [Luteitalea sp. TBR-22]BCS30854.1 aminopeptidase [Luteitalea sp. TBR-22]